MIRSVGFLENVWPLSVSLYRKERRDELRKAEGRLVVRRDKWLHPGLTVTGTQSWASLKTAIQKMNRNVLEAAPQWEIAEAAIEDLPPAGIIPWEKGDDGIEVHAAIVTNPQAMLFSELGAVNVPVGTVVMYDAGGWRSAINNGSTARLHLVMTLRKREIG